MRHRRRAQRRPPRRSLPRVLGGLRWSLRLLRDQSWLAPKYGSIVEPKMPVRAMIAKRLGGRRRDRCELLSLPTTLDHDWTELIVVIEHLAVHWIHSLGLMCPSGWI